ncbi:MAG: PEP-CTERM sorting domain-containing protein [Akkermansia sp.]|nr:PEP-CTERM sorting domain-containing protein [Akkermansia sp.]
MKKTPLTHKTTDVHFVDFSGWMHRVVVMVGAGIGISFAQEEGSAYTLDNCYTPPNDEFVLSAESDVTFALDEEAAGVPSVYALRSSGADIAAVAQLIWSGNASNIWQSEGADASSPWQDGAEFADGNSVLFDDSGRVGHVILEGKVAPGLITVSANNVGEDSGTGNSELEYGYAFTGTGSITDYTDSNGNVHQTAIYNEGTALLVLDTRNTFSGGVTLERGASVYIGCAHAAGSGAITMMDNTKVIVNYGTDDSEYRAPSLDNRLNITGHGTVSYGTAAFGESTIPCDWRNVSINGGVTGAGTLELRGYTYSTKPRLTSSSQSIMYNYVSAFFVNEQRAKGALTMGDRFNGTVYLKNEYNHRDDSFKERENSERVLGGAVQLTLVDDVFSEACINLTRDTGDRTVGSVFNYLIGSVGETGKAQTSDNILVLSDNSRISLRALESDFIGSSWRYNDTYIRFLGLTYVATIFEENYKQADERWLARVVTDSNTTLVLNGKAGETHTFSGSMGFSQSYTQGSQGSIELAASFNAGSGTLGTTTLSLDKRGGSTQYIHTANLVNLSLFGGELGFNHLTLQDNLYLSGDTKLKLGVTGVGAKAWTSISGTENNTNTSLTVPGNLEVVTTPSSVNDALPAVATVDGSLNLSLDSAVVFNINSVMLSTDPAYALLDVNGTFSLYNTTDITLQFNGVNLATQDYGSNNYYLVSADNIVVNTNQADSNAALIGRTISLGYGYYGRLDISQDGKYLYMNVVGDPRRTWSGMQDSYVWQDTTTPNAANSMWKENRAFDNGQLVLFGNLYRPEAWVSNSSAELLSSQTVTVSSDKWYSGNVVSAGEKGFEIDSLEDAAAGFQKVQIVGDVAPAAIVIGSNYTLDGVDAEDDTNYYFFGDGHIREVDPNSELYANFAGEKTNLRKMGTGTAVMATDNSFIGGTILENGRLVMQHRNALGTGGIQMMHGAVLHGDFEDDRTASYWPTTYGNVYTGEGMSTTTVTNPVHVSVYVDPDNAEYRDVSDARIANDHDKKMVLTTLTGGSDTVVTLYGSSVSEDESDRYNYAVFKVLNPTEFYGTLRMDGNLWGLSNLAQDLWSDQPHAMQGGKVQLEIMTTEKAEGSGNGNWLNTTINLSVENGTERTVLALDALEVAGASPVQVAQVNALQGISSDGSRINSSVLNMSESTPITLQIMGTVRGDYDGVLGFGDFQKTVDYDSTQQGIGYEQHTYGCHWSGGGALNVQKDGNATQSVNSAWLNQLHVTGGHFLVDEALVVNTLITDDTKHLIVGDAGTSYLHSVVVGAGGVLSFGCGMDADAFAGIGAGVAKYSYENSAGDVEEVASSSFMLLADGATLSAHDDWRTDYRRNETVNGSNVTLEVGVDIVSGATVTINTHHFTPDATIDALHNVFGNYSNSHVIHLLGAMQGKDVHLIFNNENISAAALADGSAQKLQNGLGYQGETGSMMGYVAIRDINHITGDILVEDMTVLQVRDAYAQTASPESTADVAVMVQGSNAAIQFADTATSQFMNEVVLADGGRVLLGGELKSSTSGVNEVDLAGVDAVVSQRGASRAALSDLVLEQGDSRVRLGGTDSAVAVAADASIIATGSTKSVELHDMKLQSSLVQLQKACSLDVSDVLMIDKDSLIVGSAGAGSLPAKVAASAREMDALMQDPADASELVNTSSATTLEVTAEENRTLYTTDNDMSILHARVDQLWNVNVSGTGLTLVLADNLWSDAFNMGADFLAIQISGETGRFLFEDSLSPAGDVLGDGLNFTLTDAAGRNLNSHWVTSDYVSAQVGEHVSGYVLWVQVPEPATSVLGMLALGMLASRRRRK